MYTEFGIHIAMLNCLDDDIYIDNNGQPFLIIDNLDNYTSLDQAYLLYLFSCLSGIFLQSFVCLGP